ncbi:MAG: HlyD family efflux transporter periplasmic adaptor subunit [Candidatus Paceibacterota bacterium]
MNFNFIKSKKFIIISLVVILIIAVVGIMFQAKPQAKYETVKVEKGNLEQTVDVTGNLKSAEELSLNFQSSGVISYVAIKEGDLIKKGQLIANLSLAEADAAVAQAQANLNQKLAGATLEQINSAQKQVDSAETALLNAQTSAVANLNSKYESALASLEDISVKINNTFKTVKEIQLKYFIGSSQDAIKFQNNLDLINNAQFKFNSALTLAKISKSQADIDSAINKVAEELDVILSALFSNREILDKEPYKSTVLESEKTSLDSQKTIMSTAKITISGIKNDIMVSRSQNENNINAAEAALNLQKANYDSLIAKPRDVDIAYYEAVLAQAKANRNKAIIFAPISGEISKVYKQKGELISSAEPMVQLLSPHFEIDVAVPETDVVKIKKEHLAIITFDALGTEMKFSGNVMSIEPASTNIQDVVYYRVKVGIEDTSNGLIKPGMTCNILIETDARENVLFIPSRAVLTRASTGEKYVRILENNNLIEKNVSLGLKADDGLVEILSGLEEGEIIILKTL